MDLAPKLDGSNHRKFHPKRNPHQVQDPRRHRMSICQSPKSSDPKQWKRHCDEGDSCLNQAQSEASSSLNPGQQEPNPWTHSAHSTRPQTSMASNRPHCSQAASTSGRAIGPPFGRFGSSCIVSLSRSESVTPRNPLPEIGSGSNPQRGNRSGQ